MRNGRQTLLSSGAFLVLAATSAPAAMALPLAEPWQVLNLVGDTDDVIEASGVDFSSTVALSNCSGSLVRFATSKDDDKALILTNGHCFEGGFVKAGEAIANRDSKRTFNLLNRNASGYLGTLQAEKVVYATMTNTDVTLYRLTTTYQEIATSYGVQPLTIADQHPTQGSPIRIVSGYWRRIYSCTIDRFVNTLQEGNWTFRDSILFTQPGCNTIGGTSGSPLINADTHEVIGINNTANDGGKQCTVNNPCEIDAEGHVTATRGAAYGQETYQFNACWADGNQLDLNLPGCTLVKP